MRDDTATALRAGVASSRLRAFDYVAPAHFTMCYEDGAVSHEVCASIPTARVGDLLVYIHGLIDEERAKMQAEQAACVQQQSFAAGVAGSNG